MIIVVGAGLSGAVIAERFASQQGETVLVLERRSHVGGNCYDFLDEHGILVPLYGPHFFHTKHADVWEYVQKLSEWNPYEHRVLSYVDGRYVPVPVNITTVNTLFSAGLKTPEDMKEWLEAHVERFDEPKNSEEAALSRVGRELYEKMFRNYTRKQWDREPAELDAQVMNRIPVRVSFDDRYFDDPYQALPAQGYTKMFERMLSHPNIEVRLNTDYFDVKDHLPPARMLFFTGRIDQFFRESVNVTLQYRSLRFEFETLEQEYALPATTVNYPNDHSYTRITEPKRATGQTASSTTLVREYPLWNGEPFYPVFDPHNDEKFQVFQNKAVAFEPKGVYFVGRLANYKYFNMDQAVKNALDLYERVAHIRGPKT